MLVKEVPDAGPETSESPGRVIPAGAFRGSSAWTGDAPGHLAAERLDDRQPPPLTCT